MNIYAKWFEYSLLTYENLKGATITNDNSHTQPISPGKDTIVIPALSRPGYQFLGWYTDKKQPLK